MVTTTEKKALRRVKYLEQVCKGVLECQEHFIKPTITNNDPVFSFGPNAQVICTQCVKRLKYVVKSARR